MLKVASELIGGSVDIGEPLAGQGLDSLAAMELRQKLQVQFTWHLGPDCCAPRICACRGATGAGESRQWRGLCCTRSCGWTLTHACMIDNKAAAAQEPGWPAAHMVQLAPLSHAHLPAERVQHAILQRLNCHSQTCV